MNACHTEGSFLHYEVISLKTIIAFLFTCKMLMTTKDKIFLRDIMMKYVKFDGLNQN